MLEKEEKAGLGEDQIILNKLEVMINHMNQELGGLESQIKKKGRKGKGGKGDLKRADREGIIEEISNQVAVRLREIWEK